MMVITSVSPVHSIIWLALSFVGSAMIFMQLQADFISLATIIIYVGAIAVLFIFVLMMINLSTVEIDYDMSLIWPLGLISVTTLTTLIANLNFYVELSSPDHFIQIKDLSNLQTIGAELYVSYGAYIIFASIILLVGMIGAIVLTLDPSSITKRQDLFVQISRDTFNLPKDFDNHNN